MKTGFYKVRIGNYLAFFLRKSVSIRKPVIVNGYYIITYDHFKIN